mmetsp:Transcript_26826/g.40551  ORF Transcript_26826/g.40551 Transcript_26826/m.40551 type:complete len:144 (-) Transcript_26826:56-487(-)
MKSCCVSVLVIALVASSEAFVLPSSSSSSIPTTHLCAQTSSSRAEFLRDVAATSIASVIVSLPGMATADDTDDLAMPTADEQKALDEAALQEKLRRKAELQKQARRPIGYADSMEAEKRKQQSLKKSKEEKRIALCEELGRGC